MTPAKLGGIAWLGCLQFFIVEAIAAASYIGGYSYRHDYISDLGAIGCTDLCSPRHALMNSSFMSQGALIGVGLALAGRALGAGAFARAGKFALAACALGVFVVGAAPEDIAPGWHYAGAVANLAGCNLAAVFIGLDRTATADRVRRSGVLAGAIGLAACGALGARFGGLEVGIVERLAAYPFLMWLIALGGVLARGPG